jgi:hypothetical protein
MDYSIATQYQPCTLCVTIRSLISCVIGLQVFDPAQANTFFTDRIYPANAGEEIQLQVNMPLSPGTAIVRIMDQKYGSRSLENETSFKVLGIKRMGLWRCLEAIDLNGHLLSFIDLAQRFSYNAGILPTNPPGEAYCSRDIMSEFKLKYLPGLFDPDTSALVITPARIETATKIFEVSKPRFIKKTVAERMCVLCHEYSHEHLNEDPENELEADLNGLSIYLALGYPRIEAVETYYESFSEVPSDENIYHRLQPIEEYIDAFYDEFYYKKAKT